MSSSPANVSNSDNTIEQQRVLISSLTHADAYPHKVDAIQLIETHISWVILTGDYAYKIKKNVNFGFLDFSSLEKRRRFCEEEIRLNGRLAPALYLEVVPICGSISNAQIDGESNDRGEPIEYAVKMLQFDLHNGFDVLLSRNELTLSHMEETAKVLTQFHSTNAVTDKSSSFGSPEAIWQPVIENFDQLAASLQTVKTEPAMNDTLQHLRQWTTLNHEKLTPTFLKRKNEGFIRECHGDLHLRNIVIWEGQVTPFDGIEFNDNLRWIDVISELAFLLMDLDDHQQETLDRKLLNTYLSLTGDYAGLRVLRYYQIYRAMVRAKVSGLLLGQTEDKLETSQQLQEIRNYLSLAEKYTHPQNPVLVITHGLSGSGKTVLSKQLSIAADFIHLRSDVERKRYFGLTETAQTGSSPNSGIYHPESTRNIYEHLLGLTRNILQSGFSVLVDATFLQRQQRDDFKSLAADLNIPFTILHCEAKSETLKKRIRLREQEGKDASEASEAVLEKQLQTQQPLDADEIAYTHTAQTTQTTGDIDIKKILSATSLS